MGRKAKLKKQRKQVHNKQSQPQYQKTEFVNQLQRQGYSLKQTEIQAPEMPDDSIQPQV